MLTGMASFHHSLRTRPLVDEHLLVIPSNLQAALAVARRCRVARWWKVPRASRLHPAVSVRTWLRAGL